MNLIKTTLVPTENRLLCIMCDGRTDTNIVLPEGAEPVSPHGKVIAIGPDVKAIAVGDRVIFLPNVAIGYKHEDQVVFFVNEGNILAKLVTQE